MEKDDLEVGALYVMVAWPKLRRLVEIKEASVVYDIHDDGTEDTFEVPLDDFLRGITGRL